MIVHKKEFYGGFALLVGFVVVLVIMFMPIFGEGKNGLDYMDSLYNSISKGSAYYIPDIKEQAKGVAGKNVTLSLAMPSEVQAKSTASLFQKSGASVNLSESLLTVTGDLGKILDNCLEDSDHMFQNNGDAIREKYDYAEKQVLYNWWTALNLMDKNLKKQKKFAEAKFVTNVNKKAVECAYNYYKIEPRKITETLGIVIFSLLFYVAYTMWYGFAIMFMFEGWGLKLDH